MITDIIVYSSGEEVEQLQNSMVEERSKLLSDISQRNELLNKTMTDLQVPPYHYTIMSILNQLIKFVGSKISEG